MLAAVDAKSTRMPAPHDRDGPGGKPTYVSLQIDFYLRTAEWLAILRLAYIVYVLTCGLVHVVWMASAVIYDRGLQIQHPVPSSSILSGQPDASPKHPVRPQYSEATILLSRCGEMGQQLFGMIHQLTLANLPLLPFPTSPLG